MIDLTSSIEEFAKVRRANPKMLETIASDCCPIRELETTVKTVSLPHV